MTDLNPIIADRFTEHLEVFGKTIKRLPIAVRRLSIMVIKFYSVVTVVLQQILNI